MGYGIVRLDKTEYRVQKSLIKELELMGRQLGKKKGPQSIYAKREHSKTHKAIHCVHAVRFLASCGLLTEFFIFVLPDTKPNPNISQSCRQPKILLNNLKLKCRNTSKRTPTELHWQHKRFPSSYTPTHSGKGRIEPR